MTFIVKYVALHVPDLRAAGGFYREVFAMDLLFRESETPDGTWHTLRPGLDWDEATARGVDVGMLALRRDAFVLALFRGSPAPGAVYELCVGVSSAEVNTIRDRVARATEVLESGEEWFRFRDPFGFCWSVQPVDAPFRSSGEIAGRWLP